MSYATSAISKLGGRGPRGFCAQKEFRVVATGDVASASLEGANNRPLDCDRRRRDTAFAIFRQAQSAILLSKTGAVRRSCRREPGVVGQLSLSEM
jgi:hypothetical protein